jgi:hypothetical protein
MDNTVPRNCENWKDFFEYDHSNFQSNEQSNADKRLQILDKAATVDDKPRGSTTFSRDKNKRHLFKTDGENRGIRTYRSHLQHSSIQEFEHASESKLIQVMKIKLPMTQFVPTVNLIQMKLMKVIHKMKNTPIPKFEHSLESVSIQVLKVKMPEIRLRGNEYSLQIKLMKRTATSFKFFFKFHWEIFWRFIPHFFFTD